jgi:hypothetical protein
LLFEEGLWSNVVVIKEEIIRGLLCFSFMDLFKGLLFSWQILTAFIIGG